MSDDGILKVTIADNVVIDSNLCPIQIKSGPIKSDQVPILLGSVQKTFNKQIQSDRFLWKSGCNILVHHRSLDESTESS